MKRQPYIPDTPPGASRGRCTLTRRRARGPCAPTSLLPVGGVNSHQRVIRTVVWRNSVVWCTGWNTALWLVGILAFLYVPIVSFQAMDFY